MHLGGFYGMFTIPFLLVSWILFHLIQYTVRISQGMFFLTFIKIEPKGFKHNTPKNYPVPCFLCSPVVSFETTSWNWTWNYLLLVVLIDVLGVQGPSQKTSLEFSISLNADGQNNLNTRSTSYLQLLVYDSSCPGSLCFSWLIFWHMLHFCYVVFSVCCLSSWAWGV